MPVNGYNTGKDVEVDIVTPQGILDPSIITSFKKQEKVTEKDVERMDGINDNLVMPKGWEGSLMFERRNSVLDDYFADREARYYAGEDQAALTMKETIKETGGSVSQYLYEGVQLIFNDGGESKGSDTIKQTVNWKAQRRRKVG